jgi:AcrR family transcriptional regulator
MVVKRTQAERSATTRAALLAAARELFTERGFAAAGREDIAERAGVTRGALYHHFANKQALFLAVVEDLEAEIGQRLHHAWITGADPLERLRLGCQAFLDVAMDPSVRRVVLLEAPAVLGWQAWRDLDARHGLGLVKEALQMVMDAEQIEPQPVEPLAHMLLASLNEAALLVAQAIDPAAARQAVGVTVDRLVSRL